jgi:universal stress protein E
MQRFQKILVGVDLSSGDRLAADDLSESTQEAIEAALRVAEKFHSKLTFFAGIEISAQTEELMEADREHLTRSVDDDVQEVLSHIKARADERGIESDVGFAHGHSWETIIQKVVRDGHDLVMIGTKAHSLFSRMLFGSTGMKLIRYCPCPVWVTKPGMRDREIGNVLVADDLGEVGYECLRIAIRGGREFDVRTHVLHVVEDRSGSWFGGKSDSNEQKLKLELDIAQAERILEERLTGLDHRTLEHGVQIFVKSGRPDQEIVKMIEEHEIDLLIMGTHGRSGLGSMLIGSTAERLLPQIKCSLLAIKPKDFVCQIRP